MQDRAVRLEKQNANRNLNAAAAVSVINPIPSPSEIEETTNATSFLGRQEPRLLVLLVFAMAYTIGMLLDHEEPEGDDGTALSEDSGSEVLVENTDLLNQNVNVIKEKQKSQ